MAKYNINRSICDLVHGLVVCKVSIVWHLPRSTVGGATLDKLLYERAPGTIPGAVGLVEICVVQGQARDHLEMWSQGSITDESSRVWRD